MYLRYNNILHKYSQEERLNSHQRKKDRKRWRYRVRVEYPVTGSRADDEVMYQKIWDWCAEQYGTLVRTCGWRDRDCGDRWEFDCPKKAAYFALKWGGVSEIQRTRN
jgi:hypothetical protein